MLLPRSWLASTSPRRAESARPDPLTKDSAASALIASAPMVANRSRLLSVLILALNRPDSAECLLRADPRLLQVLGLVQRVVEGGRFFLPLAIGVPNRP